MELPTANGFQPMQLSSEDIYEKEARYSAAHTHRPIPVALCRGKGVFVWDVEGKCYYDFLTAHSALNQGHAHPKIIATLTEQASQLTITSRSFYNDALGEYAQFATELFGYDKLMPSSTGAEALEIAVKLCRRWGYDVKGIAKNQAKILFAEGNFHGRTMSAVSASTNPAVYGGFGPVLPNIITIPYNDLDAFEVYIPVYNIDQIFHFLQ